MLSTLEASARILDSVTADQQAVLNVFRDLRQPILMFSNLASVLDRVRLSVKLPVVIQSLIADGFLIKVPGRPIRYKLTDPAGIDACGGLSVFAD